MSERHWWPKQVNLIVPSISELYWAYGKEFQCIFIGLELCLVGLRLFALKAHAEGWPCVWRSRMQMWQRKERFILSFWSSSNSFEREHIFVVWYVLQFCILFLTICEIRNLRISLHFCLVQVKFRQASLINPNFNDHQRRPKFLRTKGNSLHSQNWIDNLKNYLFCSPLDSIRGNWLWWTFGFISSECQSYMHLYFSSRSVAMLWLSFCLDCFQKRDFIYLEHFLTEFLFIKFHIR